MKLKVLQESFSKTLNLTSRFTSNRAQLPILANILLLAKKNKLFISATNLEMSISVTLGANVEKEGDITIPGRVISEVINNLMPGQVTLEAEKEILKISSQGFSSNISGINSSDFPSIPQELTKKDIVISNEEFKIGLNKVLFAVSSDETRPVLTGTLMLFEKNNLILVATDGFRLSKKLIKISPSKKEFKLIIPRNVLSEISRFEVSSDSEIFILHNKEENQIIFANQSVILASRIIEGEFPDYERIIPKNTQLRLSVDKNELLRGVKLASIFARDSANVVKLKIKKSSIVIAAESSHSGSQETDIDAKVEDIGNILKKDEDYTIAFNYKFVEDFLNVTEGENVRIEITDSNSPTLFLDEDDKSFIHIIMPVRLQT